MSVYISPTKYCMYICSCYSHVCSCLCQHCMSSCPMYNMLSKTLAFITGGGGKGRRRLFQAKMGKKKRKAGRPSWAGGRKLKVKAWKKEVSFSLPSATTHEENSLAFLILSLYALPMPMICKSERRQGWAGGRASQERQDLGRRRKEAGTSRNSLLLSYLMQ